MRQNQDRGRAHWLATLAVGAWLLFGPCLPLAESRVSAADSATMPTAAATATVTAIDAHLKAILAGTLPSGVDDLRAMQTHVQKLTDQLQKCTVGVTVGHAQGSGVIISKDGYVLTAAHVAGQPNRPVVFNLSDGRELRGKTLGLNRSIDAGLMKIEEPGDFPFAEMGASDTLKEGQWCLATGHPGGFQDDRGVVVRLGRVLFVGGQPQAITTDCTLVGGDSGGPLFDMDGRVIGINSRIASALSANMHVPVSTYKESWDRLAKGDAWGHFPGQTPSLGVRGEEGSTQAKIAYVYPRSAAERGGIQVGDIVVKFEDKDIADFQALKDAVDQYEPGKEVTLHVKRGEEIKEIKLNLGRKRE